MNLIATYPSFLKVKPKIWGMTLFEMFFLSMGLVILNQLGIRDYVIILILITAYIIQMTVKRVYPRRHFEFAFFTKNTAYMKDINEKLSL